MCIRDSDREAPFPVRGPADRLLAGPGRLRDDGDRVGHHEGRVEADAELADQLGVAGTGLRRLDALHEGDGVPLPAGLERL